MLYRRLVENRVREHGDDIVLTDGCRRVSLGELHRLAWLGVNRLQAGGAAKGEDAAQLMLAGASAVAVGTALFADPYAPIAVRDGLAGIAARQGLARVAELTGGVKPW